MNDKICGQYAELLYTNTVGAFNYYCVLDGYAKCKFVSRHNQTCLVKT
jgi:hypothetical protein